MATSAQDFLTIRTDNPHFWACILDGCDYSEDEIIATLNDMAIVNQEWRNLVASTWANVLVWEDGEPMGRWGEYDTSAHQQIAEEFVFGGEVYPNWSYGGHKAIPVRRWQKEIKSLRRHIKKINKMIANL